MKLLRTFNCCGLQFEVEISTSQHSWICPICGKQQSIVPRQPNPLVGGFEWELDENGRQTGRFRESDGEWQSRPRPKWWQFWRWGEFWPVPYID